MPQYARRLTSGLDQMEGHISGIAVRVSNDSGKQSLLTIQNCTSSSTGTQRCLGGVVLIEYALSCSAVPPYACHAGEENVERARHEDLNH